MLKKSQTLAKIDIQITDAIIAEQGGRRRILSCQ